MLTFINELLQYFATNWNEILTLTLEHLQLTLLSMVVAIAIGVPIGILINYIDKMKKPILAFANIMQAIPSLALLGFLIPFLGIGEKPAIVMIVVYSLLPIIKNTATGLDTINEETLEAAKGIGMTEFQILTRIKIPTALPVIMAGVRISAVASVGLVTIAAFIGAGGLGYLVYAGIRTVNNYQILAGAIPACLIALSMDWYMGKVESAVTPISLQDHEEITQDIKEGHKKGKQRLAWSSVGLAVVIAAFSVFPYLKQPEQQITIGAKNFTEQEIIVEMFAEVIEEETDLSVVLKKGLGSTSTVLSALQEGSLDMSFDYTGTIFGSIMGRSDVLPPDEIFEISSDYLAENYSLVGLEPLGFNNTYTFAVTKETAQEFALDSFSDLAAASEDIQLGCTIEFMNRADGLPGVEKAYDMHFQSVDAIDDSPRYIALEQDNVQVIDAYSTDALLEKYGLVTLEDDKQFFPPYYGFPMIRSQVLKQYPEIEEALILLVGIIDDQTMAELNYQVDELGEKPSTVAKEFLLEKNIITKKA